MRCNKYIPFAFLYFFLNAWGLPFGLTYTALLCPLFYWWIVLQRKTDILLPFFICLSPFLIIHFMLTVHTAAYFVSIINYAAVYIFCQAFYTFLITCRQPGKIFMSVLQLNFILCLIAIPLYFTPFGAVWWVQNGLADGINHLSRLKLFTYEPSYYAVLFTPLFFWGLLQITLRLNKTNSWLLLCMLLLPYLLSLSVGVISCVLAACLVTGSIHCIQLLQKKRVLNLLLLTGMAGAAVCVIMLAFYPQNVLLLRIQEILSGRDTSGNGRTSEAFILAKKILAQKSLLWGIGPGQIKILGADIIRSYYLYDADYSTIAIPNAAAETLAIFGWIGLAVRLLLEGGLFFYTRVWTNYYRLLLFVFIFLYQFTGSFITSIAEYVIWILAFTNAFPAFDALRRRPQASNTFQMVVP